jgi:hypothetical protein
LWESEQVPGSLFDSSFPHRWHAEVLPSRPLILPSRHYVYPQEAEEVERGALEVLVRPGGEGVPPFLATCALGFGDRTVPTGIWTCPKPEEICAVSGGYAYLIDTTAPEHFTMIPYRPVLEVRPLIEQSLLLFVGHRNILAWGARGEKWQSKKLSDEGLTITSVGVDVLHGMGWEMMSDKESEFALDLRTGVRLV